MHYKSIFISDLHLGVKRSQIDKLLQFLKENSCDNLFLVGDIIDFWELKRKMFWLPDYNTFFQKVLRMARKGVKVVYLIGNHDDNLRDYKNLDFGNILIREEYFHTTVEGEKILILHGDFADGLLKYHVWFQKIGSYLYNYVLELNYWINIWARKFGRHFSLAKYVNEGVTNTVFHNFEEILCLKAELEQADGILCGHIHQPDIKTIRNINYYNCGSWIEECTALVETMAGKIEMIKVL